MINIDHLIEHQGFFITEFPNGYSFSWRLLALKEYKVFRGLRDSGLMHEFSVYIEVFKRCWLSDGSLNHNLPLGMYATIGQLIMYLSGDCELETLKEDISIARSIYPGDTVNERMKHVIFTAFPNYKIHEVEEWTRPQLLRNFVLSEKLLEQRGVGYEPMKIEEIKLPGEVEEKQRLPQVVDPSHMNFEQEAVKNSKELGMWAVNEANEIEAQRSRQLTTEQAKKLDKMTRPRR